MAPRVGPETMLVQLTNRYELDEVRGAEGESSATAHRLSRALESIGWRAASDASVDEVASDLALVLAACVEGHRDLAILRRDMAECLRAHAHHLDGSAPAREEWEPAAARIIELYAAGDDLTERD
jgi:hypothetical protein